jgi:hypothetical protein
MAARILEPPDGSRNARIATPTTRHGAERADAEAQNHQPQIAFIEIEAGRELGDFWRPTADQEAIGEENQRDSQTFPESSTALLLRSEMKDMSISMIKSI